ncbi:PAP2 superfamily protein [Duganella sp. CF458]|uniref:phosphatase PAP2/dual specificity phosphatase family protein n=1 Tax=Duganella sp. CF458 TaxID=1884368 RepID=UPI0008EABEF1|nr:phosphatase PAP2/dual specificity phosphatase family protein [Duganella sp. CF458]SFG97096.1 PAP2 superfamily protein [Duganella sp. CF458]
MQLLHLIINALLFGLCYTLTNHAAETAQVQRTLALPFEQSIPFLPWMIIPYGSSGPLLAWAFFKVRKGDALRVYSRRLMFCTVAAGLVFAVFPARFPAGRAVPDHSFLQLAYGMLDASDRPYNQFPSLHITYCILLWLALRPTIAGRAWKVTLACWLLLVGASTLLTWQHAIADIAGGIALAAVACYAVRPGTTARHSVSFYYAIMTGLALLAASLSAPVWPWLYLAASLLLVALAYARRNAAFLRKKEGRHPAWIWLLFWPYLFGYTATWMLVRWRHRNKPPFAQAAEGLWVGRRLSASEARQLPPGCSIIDLSAELSETESLRRGHYRHLPLLDLQAPTRAQVRTILAAVATERRQGRPVYLHCAMGYSRSIFIARIYLNSCTS